MFRSILKMSVISLAICSFTNANAITAPSSLQTKIAAAKSCIIGEVRATSQVKLHVNLNAADTVPVLAFDQNNPSSYNYTVSSNIFDSLGAAHDLRIYFVKMDTNNWHAYPYVDGSKTGEEGWLTFTSGGVLSSVTGLTGLTFYPGTGAISPQTFDIGMTCSTQFAQKNNCIEAPWQDGYSAQLNFHRTLASENIAAIQPKSCYIVSPHATSQVKLNLNLAANSEILLYAFNPTDVSTYNFKVGVGLYDSLGAPYSIDIYFVKTENANQWKTYVYHYQTYLGAGDMKFDQVGQLTSSTGLEAITFTPDTGASTQTIAIGMTCSTQLGGKSTAKEAPWQDGNAGGESFRKK